MKTILQFLNLMDNDKLSLTNLALVIVLIKISTAPFDYSGAAILLPILASYVHKRQLKQNLSIHNDLEISKELSTMQETIASLKVDHENIDKVITDAKKLISNASLAATYKR